jgi:hypothetical protein
VVDQYTYLTGTLLTMIPLHRLVVIGLCTSRTRLSHTVKMYTAAGKYRDPVERYFKDDPTYMGNWVLDPSDPMNPEKNSLRIHKEKMETTKGTKIRLNVVLQNNPSGFQVFAGPPATMTDVALGTYGNWAGAGYEGPTKQETKGKAQYSVCYSTFAYDPAVDDGKGRNKHMIHCLVQHDLFMRWAAAWISLDAEIACNTRRFFFNRPADHAAELLSLCGTFFKSIKYKPEKHTDPEMKPVPAMGHPLGELFVPNSTYFAPSKDVFYNSEGLKKKGKAPRDPSLPVVLKADQMMSADNTILQWKRMPATIWEVNPLTKRSFQRDLTDAEIGQIRKSEVSNAWFTLLVIVDPQKGEATYERNFMAKDTLQHITWYGESVLKPELGVKRKDSEMIEEDLDIVSPLKKQMVKYEPPSFSSSSAPTHPIIEEVKAELAADHFVLPAAAANGNAEGH